ncbi:MAG: SRPBCC family protein [Actinomycetota bacterium]|nr:SRPBCC family protein [Actinomycetota bacterium]
MPTVVCARTVEAAPQRLWEVVADPERLPEWWPNVQRVEDASGNAWTTVLGTAKGRSIRADYTLLHSRHPYRLAWRQELEESPFERVLSESVTELALEPAPHGTTVRLTARLRLRGLSRFGGFQVGRATRRQLDEALERLHALAIGWSGG